jgi:hypothetical protein
VQLAPAPIGDPEVHVFPSIEKSAGLAPPSETAAMAKGAVPTFVTVTVAM